MKHPAAVSSRSRVARSPPASPAGQGYPEQTGAPHRAVHRRAARPTSWRPHDRPEADRDVGPTSHRRQPARCRRNDWRGGRRQVGARMATRCSCNSAAHAYNPSIYPEPVVRHGQGLHRRSRRSAGSRTCSSSRRRTGYQDRRRSDRRGEAKPGALNFGSAGTGSGTHINAEKFRLAAGIDVVHIPYKGHARSADRHDDGSHHIFLFADLGCAAEHARRQAGRARREHDEALERAAQRPDDRRERAAGIRLQPVGRPVRARRHAGRGRRQDRARRRARAHDARRQGAADGARAPRRCR